MATKGRNGIELLNPYVPNRVWALFKTALRKELKKKYPSSKMRVSEWYWQGFSIADEYIRIAQEEEGSVPYETIEALLCGEAAVFGMKIASVYPEVNQETNKIKYVNYILKNTRTWTKEQMNEFIEWFNDRKSE